MGPAFGGRPAISHVQFATDVSPSFNQPVTEIFTHTANTPEDKQKVLELFAELAKYRNSFAACGAVEEKENVAVLIAGWQSVEVSFVQCLYRQCI